MLITLLFLFIICGVSYIQLAENKEFLNSQMESELNNTSQALSLMLTSALEKNDIALVKTIINVVFEGGYYHRIDIRLLETKEQLIWENNLFIQKVPLWFQELELFKPISIEQNITSGWLQLANLKIQSHPGIAYQELWQVLIHTLIFFSILFCLALIITKLSLNKIFKPINELALAIKKMPHQRTLTNLPEPNIIELKQLIKSFNQMSSQLNHIYNALDKEINSLKQKLLIDNVSGLANRQYLNNRLVSWQNDMSSGTLILCNMKWLEYLYQRHGYEIRDKAIVSLANNLTSFDKNLNAIVARISNYEFAILLIAINDTQLDDYLNSLITIIKNEQTKLLDENEQQFFIGVAKSNSKNKNLLPLADNAMHKAIKNHQLYCINDAKVNNSYDQTTWRKKLSEAITNKKINLLWQPCFKFNEHDYLKGNKFDITHREIFCQLNINNQVFKAAEFIPYIELFKLGIDLDKCIIEKILESDLCMQHEEPITINLCYQSIISLSFHTWLDERLKTAQHPEKLTFDIQESSLYNNFKLCVQIVKIIKSNGSLFGIEHFGSQLNSIKYLTDLNPDYVKLDQSFSKLPQSEQNQEVTKLLINIANKFNIDVIVTGIESQLQLKLYNHSQITGYQGFISPPTALNNEVTEEQT